MRKRAPGPAWVTLGLVLANLAVFGLELSQGDDLAGFLQRWGLVPWDVSPALRREAGSDPAALVTLVSSTFLHSGWFHLATNLLYLAAFGGAVEGRLGGARYLALYAAAGVLGGLAYVLAEPDAQRPAVGASGAVAGVIAANLVLFPGATLGTLAPVLFFQPVQNIPALVLLVLWLVAQLFSGVASITGASGVAWWAHAGGFAAGFVLAPILGPRQRRWW